MVDKRKRSGSDAAASAHDASDASEDEQVAQDQPVAEDASQNKALVPFADGAELHEALKTPSADMLRLLLSRLRNQTSLSFAENTQRSTIPASDKRIQLIKDYCQLCETQASNSGVSTSAAASLFSTWELADRQDLPTLLHLPIFCLAQSLALLSIHYPTHALGSNIIERILSTNEPFLAMLHNYISNLGGAKFASSKQRDGRSSKGSDVAALASLVLLREIATFAKGRHAAKLFDSFNWSMKVLPHIFSMRRRTNRKSKTSKKAQAAQDVSLRRPDIRTLYILFLLSFLQQSYSHTLKLRLLDLGRDFLPGILKGLPQDPPDVVQTVLLHLHEDLVKDQKIPRSKKVEFWNEWACGCVVQLYSREEEHVLIHADTDAVENPSVAELAHHFLLSICTNPGFGICYPDRGWYPRKATSRHDATETVGQTDDAMLGGIGKDDFATETNAMQKGKQTGGTIYNKVLSGVLRQLAVAEDLRQQELALGILTACPELVAPYLESSCAGLSVDPRPSSRWLCNVAFFGRVVGLELPSFRVAKVEHLETPDTSAAGALTPQAHRQFAAEPPPMSSILANVLPGPLHRFLFSQGLNSADRLVRYSTCALLCRCLDRMVRFRNVCLSAISELDEDENGPWRERLDALEMEARRRIPDISIVIQILQVATSRSGANGTSDAADTEDHANQEAAGTASEKDNMLSTEVALRLLSLYYQAVPSSAFDVRFNAGKLLTNAFIQASTIAAPQADDGDAEMTNGDEVAAETASDKEDGEDSDGEEDEDDSGEINLEALCQVHTLRILSHSARAASFDWTAKPAGAGNHVSYLGLLLTLFISTPLEQVKQACEDLLRSLLASSSFFEHDPAEIDAWLASLPRADTRSAQRDEETGREADAAAVAHQLSEEQQVVVSFLDECMLRCAKTPYRYIEAARQFLQEHRQESDTLDVGVGSKDATASTDLLASPWLMAVFEQFTIRVEKGLFTTEAGTVDALTAFFVRLLPVLCAYTRHTSALNVMATKIHDQIKGNSKYASSAFLASTVLSKIHSISEAPDAASGSPKKSKQTSKASSSSFIDSTTAAELQSRLRNTARPLTRVQVSDLYQAAQKLHDSGYTSVSQILEELDPATENIALAVFHGSVEIAYGTIPVLHLPSSATLAAPVRDDFMVATTDDQAEDESTLVSWKAKDQARLAIWAAVNRSNGREDENGSLSAHIASLISIADASNFLAEEEAKQFLFVEAANHIGSGARAHYSPSLMRQISELAIQHLNPERKDHRQMVQTLLNKLEMDEDFSFDWYKATTNLVAFMDDEAVLEVVESCATVLETVEPDAPVGLLAAEMLSVVVASLDSSSRIWRRLVMRLPKIVSAVAEAKLSENEEEHADGRADLLFGVLQSILQHAYHHADASLREVFAELDFAQVVQSEAVSAAKDGALVAAIHAHPALALSVSKSILSMLSSKDEAVQEQSVQALPCTLLTLLSALLEEETPLLSDQPWSEAHLKPIVSLATSAVLASSQSSTGSVQQHATCLVLALRCAFKFGWTATQQDVSAKLLNFVKGALEDSPAKAFRGSLIEVLLGLVEEVPDFPGLSNVLQATVDAALLWLVRRFAEDANDSVDLVQTITLFTSLVKRVAETSLDVHLKKSLVDPVIQAAIKNRLRALDQMHLVLALCVHSELESTHWSRYLGALSAHSDFNTVMRGTATIQAPLQPDQDADEESDPATPDEKRQKAERLQALMVELVYTIASRDPKELLRAPLLTKLMAFYGATLAKRDRMLLALFRTFEEECGRSFASLVQDWTLPSSQQGASGSGQDNTLEALQSLDANVVFATCTEYPRALSLKNNIRSGYEQEGEETVLPGQVYGRHTEASQRYDPVFLSSLLAGVTAPEVKLSGLQWLAVFATNVPGLAVCGLSSRCADMRRASLTLVSNLYLAVREADFQEKDHLIMILDLLRDALDSSIAIQDGTLVSDAPFLPTTTTLFIAHALRSVTTPGSFIYPVISHFLLQRPELDVGDAPLLYNLLYTSTDRYKQERMWMLRFLRDVARSGGKSDWKVFKRRRTWELLASLYDACDAVHSAGVSAERAVEETAIRALVEDTTSWLVQNGDVAIELVTRRGLLAWIWQQIVREGVVALAGETSGRVEESEGGEVAGTLRSVWMVVVAQLVRSVDLDRLHRATDGAWISTTLTLTLTMLRALHRCHTTTSASLPPVSAELAHTVCSAASIVLDKLLLFAEDPAVTTQARAVVEALDKVLDLVKDSVGDEVEQTLARVQRCALTLGACIAADGVAQKSLAQLLRRSTALCQRFDSETASLVVSNLFSTV